MLPEKTESLPVNVRVIRAIIFPENICPCKSGPWLYKTNTIRNISLWQVHNLGFQAYLAKIINYHQIERHRGTSTSDCRGCPPHKIRVTGGTPNGVMKLPGRVMAGGVVPARGFFSLLYFVFFFLRRRVRATAGTATHPRPTNQ